MQARRVELGAAEAGKRLDRALADHLAVSRARVRHLLEVGRIQRGDAVLGLSDKSRVVEAGEALTVLGAVRAEDERPAPRSDSRLRIVDEGPGHLVVDKPAGLAVHPLRPDEDETVLNAVVSLHPEVVGVGEGGLRSGVVHRLDVDTSGALVFALDPESWKRLRGAFADHRVEKRYRALVHGDFDRKRRVDLPLEITRHQPATVSVREGGRPCRQVVEPVRRFARATLVEVRLETGFLHQIRVSMAHLGHPVVGDTTYGSAALDGALDCGAARQLLHATRLAIDEIEAEVPLPSDFEQAIARLAARDEADEGSHD